MTRFSQKALMGIPGQIPIFVQDIIEKPPSPSPATWSDTYFCARYNRKTTFPFTGKERDRETGFSYFGARYYDSDLTGLFLSVDPMSDKYPSISPYAYCAWNPVTILDPNGDSLFAIDAYSQNDLKKVAGMFSDLLKFEANGNAYLDYSGITEEDINEIAQHKGISLLSDLIKTSKKILYEASDIALMCNSEGTKICGFMCDDETGIINLSNGGFDSHDSHTYLPKNGFDGQIIISLSGRWTGENGICDRKEIVSHELAENYARTVLKYNYNGEPSAHEYANNRMNNPNKEYYYNGFTMSKNQKMKYETSIKQYFGY